MISLNRNEPETRRMGRERGEARPAGVQASLYIDRERTAMGRMTVNQGEGTNFFHEICPEFSAV